MRRTALAVLAVVGLAACQDMTTEPAATSALSIRQFVVASNPPPPPIDSGSVGYDSQSQTTFNLNVTYFFNKTENSGWLKFDSEAGDATVDKNAQIRYSKGVFSGKGIITVGDLSFDLSRVSQSSAFSSCTPWSPRGTEGTVPTADAAPVGCFNVNIDKVGGGQISLTEKCTTNKDVYDPRSVCNSAIIIGDTPK